MIDIDNALVSSSRKSKELSELVNEHFESIKAFAERYKATLAEELPPEGPQADEEEKAILLDLSNKIAAARNKDDLFKVIHSDLKSLFVFTGFAIVLIRNENQSCHLYEFGNSVDLKSAGGSNQLDVYDFHFPASFLYPFKSSAGPVFLDIPETIIEFPNEKYLKLCLSKGSEKIVLICLRVSGEVLGYLLLHVESGMLNLLRINLLQGICCQLSVALSNISRIDEITRRNNDMELLLSINTAIASIRNTQDLTRVIKNNFKQLLGCSHTLIAVLNDDRLTASAFLLDEESKAKVHVAYNFAKSSRFPVSDLVLSKAMQTDLPVLFDLDEMALNSNMPLYVKVNYESGQKALMVIRFAKGDQVFGFWLLYFEEKTTIPEDRLTLVRSISHQLSIAVDNVIANQEIKAREEEKERLLKFSNAIASVRDKTVLSRILKVQLYELFGLNDYIIHVLNREKFSYMPILYDPEACFIKHPDFSERVNTPVSMRDSFLELTLLADGPISYQINGEAISPLAELYRLPQDTESGKILMAIAIKLDAENISVMTFTHLNKGQIKEREQLLKSICSQIGITVANIIANEKLHHQLVEINRYKQQLEEETVYLKEEIDGSQHYAEIIGESPVMQKTFRLVAQVAPSESTVLILGETGTGKELIARAIHNNSPRRNKLMVKVNCAALPANLIESELFGHEKGSFTGATERRIGKFELANNGTLFLDEIGEMPLELQVKLLRALQEKEIERVGGRGTIKVDVRIIAATNRELEREVEEGRFRSDLYYRLNIFPIHLAALRERKDDIPLLATYFIHRYSKKTGRQITSLGSKALNEMMQYSWPGNIRELEHLILASPFFSM